MAEKDKPASSPSSQTPSAPDKIATPIKSVEHHTNTYNPSGVVFLREHVEKDKKDKG